MSDEPGAQWRVGALWRYPVKSMQGEACEELALSSLGAAGDRQFGVMDERASTVLSAKREGRLLEATAATSDGSVRVTLPGGDVYGPGDELDERLSEWLGRRVRLVASATVVVATYEAHEDFEDDDSPVVTWEGTSGSFVDESPLHVLTSLDLEQLASERPDLQWHVRRFRPNMLLDPVMGEPAPLAVGSRVVIGECEVLIEKACSRCVMTTRAQPGALDRQLEIFRHVARQHGGDVGVRATVVRAGVVRRGDPVVLA